MSKNARLTVRMLKTGMPVGIMSMVTAVGGMILQFFVNDLGASAVAAYAASTKIRSVIGEFSNALGMTFMTFVGQNYGAQKYDRIKAGVRMGVLLSILIHIPLSAVEIFGGKRIASLMVTDPPVLELCGQYLLIVGIFVFFLGFLMVFRNKIKNELPSIMLTLIHAEASAAAIPIKLCLPSQYPKISLLKTSSPPESIGIHVLPIP